MEMTNEEHSKAIETIVEHYGPEHQLGKAIEELKELIQAIETNAPRTEIIGEVADVVVMLDQITLIKEIELEEIGEMVFFKLRRQLGRIQEEKAESSK